MRSNISGNAVVDLSLCFLDFCKIYEWKLSIKAVKRIDWLHTVCMGVISPPPLRLIWLVLPLVRPLSLAG